MIFFVRYTTDLSFFYASGHVRFSDIAKMRESGSANSGSLSASKFLHGRIGGVGGRVPSAISMTLHPANGQDAHRTPVPDAT